MLKKVRLKFIFTIMSILFFVFVSMGFVSYTLMKSNFKKGTESTLKMLLYSVNDESKLENIAISRSIVFKESISGKTNYIYDANMFSQEDIIKYYEQAKNSNKSEGKINTLYYNYKENIYFERYVFVATDRAVEIQIFNNNVIRIFLILIGTYFLLGIIVWLISYRITKPIQETLYKQKQFISDASHELKTPVSIISANADVIKNQSGTNEWLENIKEQTQRMGILINDMLSLAKMEESREVESPVNFNLSNVITNSVLSFDAVAFEQEKKLSTFIAPNVIYKGNEESVKKIINILIENALKYSNNEGDIICSLEIVSGKPIIKVYNTTDDIKANTKNKLFERFYRAELSRNRSTGGSGLGLSIAKKIADNNKWKILVNIEENRSLTISVAL